MTAVFDNSGNVVERYAYDPYGTPTIYDAAYTDPPLGSSAVGWAHLFQGLQWDATTGKSHARHRDYDPAQGRWTSNDPLGFGAGDVNLYRMVGNSPAGLTDPSGLQPGPTLDPSIQRQLLANGNGNYVAGFSTGNPPSTAPAPAYPRYNPPPPPPPRYSRSNPFEPPPRPDAFEAVHRTPEENRRMDRISQLEEELDKGKFTTEAELVGKETELAMLKGEYGIVAGLGLNALARAWCPRGAGGGAAGLARRGGRTARRAPAHAQRPVLYHYTNEGGVKGITGSEKMLPSLAANNPKDVRYGEGVYMSDIAPGKMTPAQLSRAFLGMPYQGNRFTHYVAIDVTGLDLVKGRTGVFVVPCNQPLDVGGRIVDSGPLPPLKK